MIVTVAEISERMGMDREVVRGLVRFLVAAGIARDKGERPPPPGVKGRGERVYAIDEDSIATDMKRIGTDLARR